MGKKTEETPLQRNQRATQEVINILKGMNVPAAIAMLTALTGQMVAHLSEGNLAFCKARGEMIGRSISTHAYAKLNHALEVRRGATTEH